MELRLKLTKVNLENENIKKDIRWKDSEFLVVVKNTTRKRYL